MPEQKQIRAFYSDDFIRVYQAYNHSIANSALENKKFISPPFKIERTTWIKPSFAWMMYRSGYATKKDQEKVLAIDITHEGFLWALENSCLSHFDGSLYESQIEWDRQKKSSPVVIQWDPERDLFLNKLDYRSIQIGLTPAAVPSYINDWIVDITDITSIAHTLRSSVSTNKTITDMSLYPSEKPYCPPYNLLNAYNNLIASRPSLL